MSHHQYLLLLEVELSALPTGIDSFICHNSYCVVILAFFFICVIITQSLCLIINVSQ